MQNELFAWENEAVRESFIGILFALGLVQARCCAVCVQGHEESGEGQNMGMMLYRTRVGSRILALIRSSEQNVHSASHNYTVQSSRIYVEKDDSPVVREYVKCP